MVAFIVHFYGHALTSLNGVLLTGSGDGLKNYFTYAWHIERDTGLLHFGGSGYPFGDHVFFTDGHPLLSWTLQLVPVLSPFKIGILNLFMLLGLLACAWCLYGVMRWYAVVPWAAALGAFGLTVLQPQLFRIDGHLSLSHCWIIPLTWYLVLHGMEGRTWLRWSVLTGVVIMGALLTHPYLGFMCALFLVGYHALRFLVDPRSQWRSLRTYLEPVVSIAVPMLVFMLLMRAEDRVEDRPSTPHGASEFATTIPSLVVPTHPPLNVPFDALFDPGHLEWEAWCYLGLSSVIVLFLAMVVQLWRWVNRDHNVQPSDGLWVFLGAAFLVLLFAMNFWQSLFGKWLPMLTQFRATGRFAWVFFHVCGVFCVVRMHQWFLLGKCGRSPLAVLMFVLFAGLYVVEGWSHHEDVSSKSKGTANLFDGLYCGREQLDLFAAAAASGSEAIIPLPYMHVGSDQYLKDNPEAFHVTMYPVAYHSGIPLMSGNLTRTSLSQTRELMALLAPRSFPKRISRSVSANARFLMLWGRDPLDPEEQVLWDRGTPLFENSMAVLRTISSEALFACDARERFVDFNANHGAMAYQYGWRRNASDDPFPFPDDNAAAEYAEGGILAGVVKDISMIMEFEAGQLDASQEYEFSVIFHPIDPEAINSWLILESKNTDGTDVQWERFRNLRALPMQFPDHTIATFCFKPSSSERQYKIFLSGPDHSEARFELTHPLIRPIAVDAWREGIWYGRATVFFNNVPLDSAANASTEPLSASH